MKFTFDGKEYEFRGEYQMPASNDHWLNSAGAVAFGTHSEVRAIVNPVYHECGGVRFQEVPLMDSGDPGWLTVAGIDFEGPIGEQIREVIEAYAGRGFVGGGAARYLFEPHASEPADIDVFLFRSGVDESPMYEMGYVAEYATHRFVHFLRAGTPLPVQVVTPHESKSYGKSYGTPLEVLSQFAFTTEQAAVWHGAGGPAGLLSVAGLRDTRDRVLRPNFVGNPIVVAHRAVKTAAKGYKMSVPEMQSLFDAVRSMDSDEFQRAMVEAQEALS